MILKITQERLLKMQMAYSEQPHISSVVISVQTDEGALAEISR